MGKRTAFGLGVAFLAVAIVGAYVAWAFRAAAKINLGWAGLRSAWPYLLAGVLTVEAMIIGFVWLAFYSARRGFDDRAGLNDH
jgi:hypothetical protein